MNGHDLRRSPRLPNLTPKRARTLHLSTVLLLLMVGCATTPEQRLAKEESKANRREWELQQQRAEQQADWERIQERHRMEENANAHPQASPFDWSRLNLHPLTEHLRENARKAQPWNIGGNRTGHSEIYLPVSRPGSRVEAVAVLKVIENDSKAIIKRRNGEMFLIDYGVGVLSIGRYEGKAVWIYSPGSFCGAGASVMLTEDDQKAPIWGVEEIPQ